MKVLKNCGIGLLTCTILITLSWITMFQSFLINPKQLLDIKDTIINFQLIFQIFHSSLPSHNLQLNGMI